MVRVGNNTEFFRAIKNSIPVIISISRKVEAPLIPVIAEAAAEPAELARLQAELPKNQGGGAGERVTLAF